MSDWPIAETSDNTQHSQQTAIHTPGWIRTHNLSKRAAADLRITPRGHWDRRQAIKTILKTKQNGNTCEFTTNNNAVWDLWYTQWHLDRICS